MGEERKRAGAETHLLLSSPAPGLYRSCYCHFEIFEGRMGRGIKKEMGFGRGGWESFIASLFQEKGTRTRHDINIFGARPLLEIST